MAIGSRQGWRLDPAKASYQVLSFASVVRGIKMLPDKVDLTYDQIQMIDKGFLLNYI